MLKTTLWLGTTALASVLLTPAIAQDTAEPVTDGAEVELADASERIVVTAAKREQTLQDVPIAVSVVDGETIQRDAIRDIIDLQTAVPSLRVNQLQNTNSTNFLIRGFGNGATNIGIEPSIGVFIDGVYRTRSSSALADLPNLERVEVLRGPQSTLFGKNASGGVISIVTAAPEYEHGGYIEAEVGNLDFWAVEGDVTGAVVEDKLAYRLYGRISQRDGFFENLDGGEDSNNRDRWALRGQLLFEPVDTVSMRLIADYDQIDEVCCGVGNILEGPTGAAIRAVGGDFPGNQPFARAGNFNFDSRNELENYGISLESNVDFGAFTLTSIVAYREQDLDQDGDNDFTSADLLGSNAITQDIETFTQEVRLTSNGSNFVDWLVGVFYLNETLENTQDLVYGDDFRAYGNLLAGGQLLPLEPLLGFPDGTIFAQGQGRFGDFAQDNESYSFFAQADVNITDRLTITGGVNYTKDTKDVRAAIVSTDPFSAVDFVQVGVGGLFQAFSGGLAPTPENFAANPQAFAQAQALSTVPCTAETGPACNQLLAFQPLQFLPPVPGFPNAVENGETDDDKVTWTARIAYDVLDSVNVYFSAATGFKASSWNLSQDTRPLPGDVPALEAAGIVTPNLIPGTRFAGPEDSTVYELGMKAQFDQVSFNVALFDQTIEGFQSNLFTGTGFALANAGEQSVQGIEFDARYTPIEELELTVALTYLDPVYDSFVGGLGPNGPEDLTGQRPGGIHTVSLATSATYTREFYGFEGYVHVNYLYESDTAVVDNVAASIASREVNLLNASIGLSPVGQRWSLQVWGRNLTNDDYLLTAFPSIAQEGSFSGYPNEPRIYGATIRLNY